MRRTRRVNRSVAPAIALALALGFGALAAAPASGQSPPGQIPDGYLLLTSNGGVFDFGVQFRGAPASDPTRCAPAPLPGRVPQPNGTCGSIAVTPSGAGYWVMNSVTGAIYAYGHASMFGSPQARFAGTSPEFLPEMRQIVSSADGNGYWVYEVGASDIGTVDHYGDAGFFGDTITLVRQHRVAAYNGRPVGMAATADGKGYWEVYSDGGVFAFGSARFLGSMAARPLAAPIVGITGSASGKGYWLVASDGGVFAFGDARFAGSRAGLPHAPIIALTRNPVGPGYLLASNNGQIFTFGGAPFGGTLSTIGIHGHVSAIGVRSGTPSP